MEPKTAMCKRGCRYPAGAARRSRLLALEILILACLAAAHAQTPKRRLELDSAGYRYNRGLNWEVKESGGLPTEPRFQHARIQSRRYLAGIAWTYRELYVFTALAGMADLRIHGSEGETVRFDRTFALGAQAEIPLCGFENSPCILAAGLGLLIFNPSGSEVVRVRSHDWQQSGEFALEWREYEAALYMMLPTPDRKIRAGLKYLYLDANQDRDLPTGQSFGSSYELKDPVGLFLEMEQQLARNVAVSFMATAVGTPSFGFSAKYMF